MNFGNKLKTKMSASSLATLASLLLLSAPPAWSSCSDMTHSECPATSDAIILKINVPEKINCLRLCQAIGERCYFYVYEKDSFTENCRLYRESFHTFVDNCNVIGGPKELLEDCSVFSLTDNTKTSFKEGNCLYSSTEEIFDMTKWQNCQLQCLKTSSCNYWKFVREEKSCHLLESPQRSCLFAFGENTKGDTEDCMQPEECPQCQGQVGASHGDGQTCQNCPVDGGWSGWGAWPVKCNTKCGEGTLTRTRMCNNPPPMFGGQRCQGGKNQTRTCSKKKYCTGKMTLYTGSDDNQSELCKLSWSQGTKMAKNFKKYLPCKNDEASSAVIEMANADTTITLYDSAKKNTVWDYLTIQIKKDITEPLRIDSFEKSFSNDFVDVTYVGHPNTIFTSYGLNGKLSSLVVESQ